MASPFDLVSLADYKSYMSLTSTANDAVLQRLITSISRAILTKINRPAILPTTFTEVRDGGGECRLFLDNFPVFEVSSLTVNGSNVPASPPWSSGGAAPAGYWLDPPDVQPPGKPQMVTLTGASRFTPGLRNVSITYRAGYETSETASVPTVAPYTIDLVQAYGAWAVDVGVTGPNGAIDTSLYSAAASIYTFDANLAGQAVSITYGYIPADLALAAMDWVADRAAYLDRIGLASKTLGGQETVAFLVKTMPDFVAQAIQQYMNVVPLTC